MDIRVNSSDLNQMMPIFLGGLVAVMIITVAVYYFVKMQDNNKKLITRKIKVLEKPTQQGNIEWYVVECEDGERIRLRSFQADKIIITVGDVGIVGYKGKTIQSFTKE